MTRRHKQPLTQGDFSFWRKKTGIPGHKASPAPLPSHGEGEYVFSVPDKPRLPAPLSVPVSYSEESSPWRLPRIPPPAKVAIAIGIREINSQISVARA